MPETSSSYSPEQLAAVIQAVEEHGSINKAASALGIARSTAQSRFKAAQGTFDFQEQDKPQTRVEDLLSSKIPIEELVRRQVEDSRRKMRSQDQKRRGVQIKVPSDPYGIVLMGDPHVDDAGCDIAQLFQDADTIRETDGMFCIPAGDYQNLWIGRLARLYASQTVTAKDAWRIVEYLFERIGHDNLLAVMMGNHDLWAGANNLLEWILARADVYSEDYDLRLHLTPDDGRTMKLHMRHDFKGHSQWNKAFGLAKAAQMASNDTYHVYAAGDKHCFGYVSEFYPSGEMWHAVRARGYKMVDTYSDQLGYSEPISCPSPTVIVNPQATDEREFVRVEFSVTQAADYLKFLRGKYQ